MRIYKVFRPDEFAALQADGCTAGAPIDLQDGFIHFSTRPQLAETLAKHFAGAGPLTLLECEADDFGDALKWEVSRGGAKFPHLYAPLQLSEIRESYPISDKGSGYVLPVGLE